MADVVQHEDQPVEEDRRDHHQVEQPQPPAEHPRNVEQRRERQDPDARQHDERQQRSVARIVEERVSGWRHGRRRNTMAG